MKNIEGRQFNPLCPYIQRGTRLNTQAGARLETLTRCLHHLRFSLAKVGDEINVNWVDLCLDLLEEAFPDPKAITIEPYQAKGRG